MFKVIFISNMSSKIFFLPDLSGSSYGRSILLIEEGWKSHGAYLAKGPSLKGPGPLDCFNLRSEISNLVYHRRLDHMVRTLI
jgi:hypothetical protein